MTTGSTVLIAAPSQSIASTIRGILPPGITALPPVFSMTVARQRMERERVDLMVVYSPLPDESGVQGALEIAARFPVGILLLVRPEVYEQVAYSVGDAGIFVLARPAQRNSVRQALQVLAVMQRRLEVLESQNAKLRKKLDDLRVISRAKCLLAEKRGMTEEEGHHYLEKVAMDSCITKLEAAEDIMRRL